MLGVRTEQLAIYGTLALILCLRIGKVRISAVMPALLPWSIFVIFALAAEIGTHAGSPFLRGSALAGTDNLLLPMAVMLIVAGVVIPQDAERHLVLVSKIIVFGAVANAVLALASTRTDMSGLLRQFWAGAGVEKTTSEFAAELGRYGGIFNQPAEAGIVYGLSALLAVYVYAHRPWLLAVVLTLISVGGILCVSKIFILGGLPLALFYLVRRAVVSGRAGALLATAFLVTFAPRAFGLGNWLGLDFLVRLIRPSESQDLVDLYTAGRFSSGSRLQDVVAQLLDVSPLFGVGVSGWQVPYDSAWGESLVVAGIFGTLAVIATYAAIVRMAFTMNRGPTRDLATLLSIFLVAASFGISSLTANRAATLVWLVVALLFVIRWRTHADQGSRVVGAENRVTGQA